MTHAPTRASASEVARQHHNTQQAAYETTKRQAHYVANPDFDPALLKPVRLQPAPPMSAAERRRLERELGCLQRERAQTARAIAHLHRQLGH